MRLVIGNKGRLSSFLSASPFLRSFLFLFSFSHSISTFVPSSFCCLQEGKEERKLVIRKMNLKENHREIERDDKL